MPLLRSPTGAIVSLPAEEADQAEAGGYAPVDIAEAGATAARPAPEDRGALGGINAAATGLLSGATLGLSDYALKGALDQGQFSRLAAEREGHPIASTAGQIAGAVIPTLGTFGGSAIASAPAGILGRAATGIADAGRAIGGAEGAGRVLLAGGIEGAAQNAGMYLADTALGDRELSAEGMAAELGMGFGFGVGGGAAALGIEKGTIAVRRMFSRAMDGGDRAALDAEQAWRAHYQSTIEANNAAADIARAKLAEAQQARQQSGLARDRAGAAVAEAKARAPVVDAAHADAAAFDERAAKIGALEQGAPGPAEAPPSGIDWGAIDRVNAMSPVEEQAQRYSALSAAQEQELATAVTEHDTALAELEQVLTRLETPEIEAEQAAEGLAVPVGEFGAPGARGYDPGNVRAPGPPSTVEAQTGDVTAIGKKRLGEGTPADTQIPPEMSVIEPAGSAASNRPQPTAGPIPGTTADRIEVRKSANRRDRNMEIVEYHGGVPSEPRIVSQDEAYELLGRSTPPGFTADRVNARDNFTIASGIPKSQADVVDNAIYVVKPSELADHGIIGNKIRPADLERGAKGFADPSVKFPTVEIYMAPDGELYISDGNHRILNAAKTDRPMAVKFRKVAGNRAEEAAAGRGHQFGGDPDIDASIRIREALPKKPSLVASTDTLTGQLRAMQDQLGAGRSLNEIGAPARAEYAANKAVRTADAAEHFRAKAISAHAPGPDAFFENLTRPKTRDAYVAANIGRAMREEGSHVAALAKVEREWSAMGPTVTQLDPGVMRSAVHDVADAAERVTTYEKAVTRLVEALGPEAPPVAQEAAKAFRAAEDHAERKTMDRTTRAIDDHAEAQAKRPDVVVTRRTGGAPAPRERYPGESDSTLFVTPDGRSVPRSAAAVAPTSRQTITSAKQARLEADVAFKGARVRETEAKIGAQSADRLAADTRSAADAARPAATASAPSSSRLGTIATAIGVAGELGVPGIPKPHDIPVIGPLLSTYLKYRALKATVGRFVGRVPASGDARAAAMVAKAKERIATAVDRTLGLTAELAPKARGAIVATTTALARRAFDDGEPDARKGANAQQLAAVRIREIATAATRPELVAALVRREMSGVADPDLIAAAEQHLQARFVTLNNMMPKAPPPNPYSQREWVPSAAATSEVAQRLAVAHDPESAFVDPTPVKVDTARQVFPRLLEIAQQRLIARVADVKTPVPYQQRLRGSLLFGVRLDDSLDPQAIATFQSAHVKDASNSAPQQPGPPTPSIANATNLTALYQPGSDRRATQR